MGDKFKRILEKHLTVACEDVSNVMQQSAKEDHRYNHKTRNLRNSTKSKVKVVQDSYDIKLSVDEGKAPYAKYVIRGHGTWQGDPFIDEAFENNKEYIMTKLQESVDKAVDEFNRT